MKMRAVGTLVQRMGAAAIERVRGESRPMRFPLLPREQFRQQMNTLGTGVSADQLASIQLLTLPMDQPPWFDTGIDVQEGEWLSWFANGELILSRLLDLRIGPDFQLWARIGEGEIFRGVRNSHSFRAAQGGRLYLANYFPGEWATPQGRIGTPESDYRGMQGFMDVYLLRWRNDARAGLQALLSGGDPGALVSGEIDRLDQPVIAPAGWNHLWYLGPAEIYRPQEQHCIHCHTRSDVAILQRDVDIALQPGTRLGWDWRIDQLPSRFAEDTLPTHDYMSIACEFDNGIDITYYWSAKLPVDYGYWCPLPTWKNKEFHVVLRSGTQGLGHWHAESRDLHADYQRYIGTPPARIRRVWLIAVSLFQRLDGSCDYRNIRLSPSQSGNEISLD